MTSSAYRRRLTPLVASMVTAIALGSGVVRGEALDEMPVASMGEFRIHDGEAKLIEDPAIAGPYRICVTSTASGTPLAVTANGVEVTVKAGACHTFDAGQIRIAAAGKLAKHSVLTGTFEHVMN